MGVFTVSEENVSAVAPARLFKTLVYDGDNLIPKVIEAIQSVENLEGNGGPGTIKKITSLEAGELHYVKHKVEAVDNDNFVYNYSLIEGDKFPDTLEKVSVDTKLEAAANGGSVIKVTVTFVTKGDAKPTEEEMKMGKQKVSEENVSAVAPARLFKTLVHDGDNLIPKVIEAIQSVENLEGNGGPGTIKKITSLEAGELHYVKHKVEAVDNDNFVYKYSLIEGDKFPDTLEKVSVDTKLEAAANGGSVIKVTVTFVTKGDAKPTEEEMKMGKQKGEGLFKAIEGYLLANPDYN
ncbi:class-10 pathogenesis-related protein 1-like [Senna tora]|uniref:Class-10 pathogenesis-related protein 1-like n=1 Tax=Senna tora TaxID=362788 RepID=A0A834T2S8_9FABA|nr:class-10 pathogenesis-related protein 1-like [Senna tora]